VTDECLDLGRIRAQGGSVVVFVSFPDQSVKDLNVVVLVALPQCCPAIGRYVCNRYQIRITRIPQSKVYVDELRGKRSYRVLSDQYTVRMVMRPQLPYARHLICVRRHPEPHPQPRDMGCKGGRIMGVAVARLCASMRPPRASTAAGFNAHWTISMANELSTISLSILSK
jgi:hypothetical protein